MAPSVFVHAGPLLTKGEEVRRRNPDSITDVLESLLQPGWTTGIFWLLGLASLAIAVYAFVTIPTQRRATYTCDWAFRFLIGAIWWQQTLWKLPPAYTDHPEQPFGETGPADWMRVIGRSVAVAQTVYVDCGLAAPRHLGAPRGVIDATATPPRERVWSSRTAILA